MIFEKKSITKTPAIWETLIVTHITDDSHLEFNYILTLESIHVKTRILLEYNNTKDITS